MTVILRCLAIFAFALLLVPSTGPVFADEGHKHQDKEHMMDQMREQHRGHMHEHDFEAMKELSPEKLEHVLNIMREIGLVIPPMDAEKGRKLFVGTGCVVCHSVNDVGGKIGPSLNAADMPSPMNAFEFAARMWRGASAMAAMQEELLGDAISLTGQDLADLIAFAHDDEEQKKLTADQIPERFEKMTRE